MKRLIACGVAACAIVVSAGVRPASADIIFYHDPGSLQPDENLLFNDPSLTLTGTTIQGITNTTATLVDITGQETLVGDGGQAKVSGQDGTFTYLLLGPHDPLTMFTEFEANLSVFKTRGPAPTGTVTVTATDSFGNVLTDSLDVGGGENFFSVLATDPDLLRSIEISSTVALAEMKQIRIGGLTDPDVTPVPEPATLLLFGSGLFAVARKLRRRAS